MSQTKIYLGNLPYSATDSEVMELLSRYGKVEEIKLIADRDTGRSRGFGFVSFDTQSAVQEVMKAANSTEGLQLQSRKLIVKIAHEDDRRTKSGRN